MSPYREGTFHRALKNALLVHGGCTGENRSRRKRISRKRVGYRAEGRHYANTKLRGGDSYSRGFAS